MRVCLGMLARSDRTSEPLLDRMLSIVEPSFDGVEILYDEGQPILDFSARRNQLIKTAERKGYDWMFMLDSDECMFPEDIAVVRSLMTAGSRFIILPRIELKKDFDHYDPQPYSDYQGRVFRLGIGYRFRRPLHEGIYRRFSPVSERRWFGGTYSDTTPIYHYGLVRDDAAMWVRQHHYERILQGSASPEADPADDGPWQWGNLEVFEGPHPLREPSPDRGPDQPGRP